MREEQVMLTCAAPREAGRDTRVRTLLDAPLDWPQFEAAAEWHGVLALVYGRLRDAAPDLVPKRAMTRLRAAFTAGARRNLFLTGELLRLLDLLRSRGIPAVAYKGPTLAALPPGGLPWGGFRGGPRSPDGRGLPRGVLPDPGAADGLPTVPALSRLRRRAREHRGTALGHPAPVLLVRTRSGNTVVSSAARAAGRTGRRDVLPGGPAAYPHPTRRQAPVVPAPGDLRRGRTRRRRRGCRLGPRPQGEPPPRDPARPATGSPP